MKVFDGVVVELRSEDGGMCQIARVEGPRLEEDAGLHVELASWDISMKHEEWYAAEIKEGTKVRVEIGGE